MNKLSKIFLAIIVILIVIIIISLNRWLFFKDAYVSAVTENMRLIQRAEEIEKVYDRNMDNVKIEITQASSTGATIIITDNNKVPYIWKEDYKIEQKENDKWEEVKATSDITFSDEVYERDNNNQIKQEINWSNTYGTLQTGTYRIVKYVYTVNSDMYFESTEFTIE